MTSEDEHVSSDVFDVSNLINPPIFASDSDQFKSPISDTYSCNNYLRESISEALSCALAYVVIYRPEDPIEFLSNFLIDWSRQKLINHQSSNIVVQTFVNEENDDEHSLKEQGIVSGSDKHFSSSSYQEASHINSHQDNEEGELSSYFDEQTHLQRYIHTHDTASGFDDHDPMKSNDENKRNYLCQDGNLSSFTYFSKLREKIIKCDES